MSCTGRIAFAKCYEYKPETDEWVHVADVIKPR